MKKTINDLNRSNPEKYVMVSNEFNYPIYIGALIQGNINVVESIKEAETWNYADTISKKLDFHRKVTGLNLEWQKV